MVCSICPNSCLLTIISDNNDIKVENNRCPRGVEFARKELTDPERILTSTVRIQNGILPLVSVRSDAPVKKAELKNLIKQLDVITVSAPIVSGQVLLSSVGKNQVNIIATRTIESKILEVRVS
jgi:CxxC motif-containing protein